MTKTTREIEEKANDELFYLCLGIFALLLALGILGYVLIENQISQLPHKVCHNETETIEYIHSVFRVNLDIGCFSLDSKILCTKGLMVKQYPGLNQKCVFAADGYNWDKPSENKCLVEIQKEVCEIK